MLPIAINGNDAAHTPQNLTSERVFMKRAVEAAIRIGTIAGLIVWCFIIARPFLIPIVWGAIIAVAIFHGYEKLRAAFGADASRRPC